MLSYQQPLDIQTSSSTVDYDIMANEYEQYVSYLNMASSNLHLYRIHIAIMKQIWFKLLKTFVGEICKMKGQPQQRSESI